MKYRQFIKILGANGFYKLKRTRGSHSYYEGFVGKRRQVVTVAYRQLSEDIRKDNLASMIRQSGLPKKIFRN